MSIEELKARKEQFGHYGKTFPEERCIEIRERLDGDTSVIELHEELDINFSITTMRKHGYGKCKCDHDTPPGEYPDQYNDPYESGK